MKLNAFGYLDWLGALTVIEKDKILAVGNGHDFMADRAERPVMFQWGGASLGEVTIPRPNPYAYEYALNSIDATSPADVWAVGAFGYDSVRQEELMLHWNGATWSIVPGPPTLSSQPAILNDVVALSRDNVWAVGYADEERPLILHWDGAKWAEVKCPVPVGGKETRLEAVTAISPSDIWAVGRSGAYPNSQNFTVHWDGNDWFIVPSPNVCSVENSLSHVSASGPKDVWAIGWCANQHIPGPSQTVIQRWDGSKWQILPLPSSVQDGGLGDVVSVGSDDVWVIGASSAERGPVKSRVLHWDGAQWGEVPLPTVERPGLNDGLYDIDALSNVEIGVVGISKGDGLLMRFVRSACSSD